MEEEQSGWMDGWKRLRGEGGKVGHGKKEMVERKGGHKEREKEM